MNILLVDDNLGDARLVAELFKDIDLGEIEITYATDLASLGGFKRTQFDVILLDLHLGDNLPAETYKITEKRFPQTPIIVLTGVQDEKLPSQIVRLGAQDYLLKGRFGASTLERSVSYAIDRKKNQIRIVRETKRSRNLRNKAESYREEAERLETINHAKDVFLSIASHQLRTPASAVKQYLGMLLEGYAGKIPAEQLTFIETAFYSNERQLKIVDDLLKVARLDAGHVSLNKTPTRLNPLVKSIIADQAKAFEIRRQKIVFLPAKPDYSVMLDADNIRMVFDNLLDNAGKYSPEHTTITIKIVRGPQKISVEFLDEGIGISDDDVSKLFQKFSRIGKSFRYAPNGSGLGLYWANEIVKLHGGLINLQSTLDKGSKFTVELPA